MTTPKSTKDADLPILYCSSGSKLIHVVSRAAARLPDQCRFTSNKDHWTKVNMIFSCPPDQLGYVLSMTSPHQMVDRYPATGEVTSKLVTALQLRHAQRLYPTQFTFAPRTYVLPLDATELPRQMDKDKNLYICKPSYANCGEGIFLVTGYKDLQ